MPIRQCQSGGKPGVKWGDSGKCYTYTSGDTASRKRAVNKANKQAAAAHAAGFQEQFIPPESGDAPQGVKSILRKVYDSCRSDWVKDHPGDKENASNKTSCSRIAWTAVKNAGWKKVGDKWKKETTEEVTMVKKVKSVTRIKDKDVIETMATSFADVNEAGIDSDNNRITGVCIFGRKESLNQRIYSDKAIESITRLAEGAKCFADHPSKTSIKENDGVRGINSWIGIFENARRVDDKVFADLHVRESYFPLLQDIALMQPKSVGMSINATVKVFTDNETGMEGVADVATLRSADLVSSAATTENLWESVSEENIPDAQDLSTEIMIEDKIKALTQKALAREGIIRDKIDEQELEREINKVSWTAQDLIFDTFRDDDLSTAGKRNKINEVFDDLEIEIEKITSKMNESIKEDKMEEVTLEMLRKDHPEVLEAYKTEISKGDALDSTKKDVERLEGEVQTLKDEAKSLKDEVETAGDEKDTKEQERDYVIEAFNALEEETKELRTRIDEMQVADKLASKRALVEEKLSTSKLPKEAITDQFKEDLMSLEAVEEGDDAVTLEQQIDKRIEDRKTVTSIKKPVVEGMGESNDEDPSDTDTKEVMSQKEIEEAVEKHLIKK